MSICSFMCRANWWAARELSAIILHFFCAAATKGYLSVLLFHRLDPYRLATQFQVMKNSDAKKPDCAWFVYLLSFTPADSGALWSLTVSEQGGI